MPAKREFTYVQHGQLAGLALADASAKEVLAYMLLTQYHGADRGYPDHPSWCSVPQAEVARKLGMRVPHVSRAYAALTRKTFPTNDGREVPVLTRVRDAHGRRCAVYADNLFEESVADRIGYQFV